MGMPVKLSDELVRAARAEAKAQHRSITAQIEHWAKLGRAAQTALSEADRLTLAACTEALDAGEPGPEAPRLLSMREHLLSLARSSDRSSVLAELRAGGGPRYEADPDDPELVVRVEADGRRTRGEFEGGQFRPETARRKAAPAR